MLGEPPMLQSRVKGLAASAGRGVVVGVGSGAVLVLMMVLAESLREVVWSKLPPAFGATEATWWWIVLVLTLTGVAVGLVVRYIPGHAGPDPATEDLFGHPLPLLVLPGLALAFVLMSAGGVSLGPEGPVIGITVALAVWLGTRGMPGVEAASWQMLAVAGTLGAAFGTPVAAALILSEIVSGKKDKPFWDQMCAPLAAAGAGTLTMMAFHQPNFTLALPAYRFSPIDLVSGPLITLVGVAVAASAVWLFPRSHKLFHSIRSPVLMLGLGGLALGVLGAVGGPISLFNGQKEIHLLAESASNLSIAALLGFVVTKTAALVVAATCGFHGGRIFPSVFAGVAIGLTLSKLVPGMPVSLAIACAVLGFTLVVSRSGWLSLFMGAVVVPDVNVVPLLCVAILPAWIVAVSIPQMRIVPLHPTSNDGRATGPE